MNYSLNKLLRKGHVIEMSFIDVGKNNSYYISNGRIVHVIENALLTDDAENVLIKDWNDEKLHSIFVIVSNLDKKQNIKVLAWNKNKGEFDWPSINSNIRVSRISVGFCDKRLVVNELKVQPLKILAATVYRDHYGIISSHEISNFMDFETHKKVLGRLVWKC